MHQCCTVALRRQAAGEWVLLVLLISDIVCQDQIALIPPILFHISFSNILSFGRKQFQSYIKAFHWLEIFLFCFSMFMFLYLSITNFLDWFLFYCEVSSTGKSKMCKVSHLQYHQQTCGNCSVGDMATNACNNLVTRVHDADILLRANNNNYCANANLYFLSQLQYLSL